jgi:hypothetical protein
VLETRPPKLTRENFVGDPLMVILYGKKLEPLVGCRSEKTGRRLHVSWTLFVWGAGRRHFCTPPAATFSLERPSVLALAPAVYHVQLRWKRFDPSYI